MYSGLCVAGGPRIDHGPDQRSPGRLAKLRRVGDWVEFSVQGGVFRAIDHKHQEFLWDAQVAAGEIWVPTVAWTGTFSWLNLPVLAAHTFCSSCFAERGSRAGSRAQIRLAPPEIW